MKPDEPTQVPTAVGVFLILAVIGGLYFFFWDDLRFVAVGPQPQVRQAPAAAFQAPTIPDYSRNFEIISVNGEWDAIGYLHVIGEVRNNGSIPSGVELQAIARDENGVLVDAVSFWPASLNNISAGASVGVRHPLTQNRNAQRVELRVLGARPW